MKTAIFRAILLTTFAATTLAAADQYPPFDYFVSLYKWPNHTEADGSWTEKVIVYIGNGVTPGSAPEGQPFNLIFNVGNAAGAGVCSKFRVQDYPIPSGKTWGTYAFQVVHPKPKISLRDIPPPLNRPTPYTLRATITPERYASDVNKSNNTATQTFQFTSGGTPSCQEYPRPVFHTP
jgi:hypothetical protein